MSITAPETLRLNPLLSLAERGILPDALIRRGMRRLIAKRLRRESLGGDPEAQRRAKQSFLDEMRRSPVALHTDSANEQHYEVPAAFYRLALGPHLKYSSCHFESPDVDLGTAEAAMLRLTCERADIADGQRILELGCGWGSLTLWMAEHFPRATITAVSNSATQREHIMAQCAARGLGNVEVITADMNTFDTERRFDRAVSVEMFEHMRNWEALLARITGWLEPEGKLFIHIFCHRSLVYAFETEGSDNWMGRHFFTGGIMPSEDLPRLVRSPLQVEQQWSVNGNHYALTAEAWLRNLDARRAEALALFSEVYGRRRAALWVQRWRMFFMACAELFAWNSGEEWLVTHCRFQKAPEV